MRENWSGAPFEAIAHFVRARTGLTFPPNRQLVAETGIRRAMERLGIRDAQAYLAVLERNGAPLDDLLAELTIGETYFFREPAQFAVLRTDIVPHLLAERGATTGLRVWSAACASGEETYSLAIMLAELRPDASHFVLGTDISRARLLSARRGHYRRWSLRGVPSDTIERYFHQHGDTFELRANVRRAAEFRYLNLAEDNYPAISTGVWGMDLVLCRNVLIYFDQQTIARVAERLIRSLSEDGWLFMGASDPVLSDFVACEVVQTPAGLVYRRPGGPRIRARPAGLRRRSHAGGAPLGTSVGQHLVSRTHSPTIPLQIDVREHNVREHDVREYDVVPDVVHDDVTATAVTHDPIEAAFAARQYERVVQLAQAQHVHGPLRDGVAIVLVRALANLGRLDEAERVCRSALEQHRLSAELLYLYAVLLVQACRFPEAVSTARQALYVDRSMIVAHLTLATALARSGEPRKAVRSLVNAERLLMAMPSDELVPASDGETAGRLLAMARTERLLHEQGTP